MDELIESGQMLAYGPSGWALAKDICASQVGLYAIPQQSGNRLFFYVFPPETEFEVKHCLAQRQQVRLEPSEKPLGAVEACDLPNRTPYSYNIPYEPAQAYYTELQVTHVQLTY